MKYRDPGPSAVWLEALTETGSLFFNSWVVMVVIGAVGYNISFWHVFGIFFAVTTAITVGVSPAVRSALRVVAKEQMR